MAALVATLGGCQTAETADGVRAGGTASQRVQLVDRDVEAPEVFQTTEAALWDGRPSLGGVWVAAEGVNQPERVIMRNQANGEEVVGALFRRERLNPGPPLQLSSDAAEALGVLAGSPVSLEVVALRRQPEPEPVVVDTPPEPVVAEAEAATSEPEVAEAAAPEAVPAGPPTTPVQVLQVSARALAFKRAAEAEAAAEAAAAQAAADAAAAEAAASAAPPEVAETPLDAAQPQAAAEPRRRGLGGLFGRRPARVDAPAPLPQPAEAAPDAAASSRAAPVPGGAYVQVATFAQERNARTAADALAAGGIPPSVQPREAGGRRVWRVVVGPAPTQADRDAFLGQARALGFADAYVVQG